MRKNLIFHKGRDQYYPILGGLYGLSKQKIFVEESDQVLERLIDSFTFNLPDFDESLFSKKIEYFTYKRSYQGVLNVLNSINKENILKSKFKIKLIKNPGIINIIDIKNVINLSNKIFIHHEAFVPINITKFVQIQMRYTNKVGMDSYLLCIYEKNILVGFCRYYRENSNVYIKTVGVDDSYRGGGLLKLIINHTHSLVDEGGSIYYLLILKNNKVFNFPKDDCKLVGIHAIYKI